MAAAERSPGPESSPGKGRSRTFLESAALTSWTVVAASLLVIAWLILTRRPLWNGAVAWVAILSLVTFLVFGLDKWRARRGRRRVSEANLLILSVLGGALGGMAGMWAWRHKGQRLRFRVILPVALFFHAVVITGLAVHA